MCEIYCPNFTIYIALKCDKSFKLRVKGLLCQECRPTLKLGIPVSVGRWPDPAGTWARAPGAELTPVLQDVVLPCVFATEVHLLS